MSGGLRIGQRLFLTVLPAVLGCVTVAGLSYWGQYGNAIPEPLLLLAMALAVGSLAVAWWNARYVAHRIARLAAPDGSSAPVNSAHASVPLGMPPALGAIASTAAANGASPDEIDAIEAMMQRLAAAVAVAEDTRTRSEASAAAQVAEYAELLSTATTAVTAALGELRLPIHILLENHFGELNENQEEMLDAARRAADMADAELDRVRRIVDLDRGRGRDAPHEESIALAELLPSLVGAAELRLRSRGEEAAQLTLEVAAPVPRVYGDLSMLHDAIALVLEDATARSGVGERVSVACRLDDPADGHLDDDCSFSNRLTRQTVRIDVAFRPIRAGTAGLALARRLIEAQAGVVELSDGVTRIRLRAGAKAAARIGQ